MVSWVEQGQVPEKAEIRGKAREVLVAPSMFDPKVFKMKDGVVMFTKAATGTEWERYGVYASWSQQCWRFGVYVIKVMLEDI